MSPRHMHRQGGFALLVTLLVLLGLAALAAGGLALAGEEAAAARTQAAGVRAYLAAQAALATFLAGPPGPIEDSVERAYVFTPRTGARLWARRLVRADAFRDVYRLSATGSHRSGRDGAGRTLRRLAMLDRAPFRPPAALTALSGTVLEGPDVLLEGAGTASADGACAGAGPSGVAGAAFPPGGYGQAAAVLQAEGTPDTLAGPTETLLAGSGIDWPALAAGDAAFDVRYPGDPWPGPPSAPDEPWPGILVQADRFDAGPGRSGRGALVVTGDLVLQDGFRWEGLLFVGGTLRASGAVAVGGAAITGLAGGADPGPDQLGPGLVAFTYDACAVAKAGRFAARLAPMPGTWSEAFSLQAP